VRTTLVVSGIRAMSSGKDWKREWGSLQESALTWKEPMEGKRTAGPEVWYSIQEEGNPSHYRGDDCGEKEVLNVRD